jgi:hypothetical protein
VKKLFLVALVGALFFVACGKDDEGNQGGESSSGLPACGASPPEVDVAGVPSSFPKPDGAVYTDGGEAGPSFIAEGYFDGDLAAAFEAYSSAFADSTYDVTKDEKEERDAEVFFAGEGTTGQVNMFADCADQTKLRITIRPD